MSPGLFDALNNGNTDEGCVCFISWPPFSLIMNGYRSEFPIEWHFHQR